MAIGYKEENGKKAIQNLVPSPGQGENISPLRKDTVLLKEPGLYCFLLSCKKPKAEPFMKWVVETVFEPREIRKLASAVEEKDVTIVLMNDDLQDRENQIQAIKYENVALQEQRDVYQAELQRCQDTITHLKKRYVPHARNPGKDNIIIIVRKHTTPANDKYHNLPYYIARIQRRKRYIKLRWYD